MQKRRVLKETADRDLGRGGRAVMFRLRMEKGDLDSRAQAAVKRNGSLLGIQKLTLIHKRTQIRAPVSSPGVTVFPSMRALKPAVFVLDNNSRMFVLFRRHAAFPSVTIRSEAIKTGGMEAGKYKNINQKCI